MGACCSLPAAQQPSSPKFSVSEIKTLQVEALAKMQRSRQRDVSQTIEMRQARDQEADADTAVACKREKLLDGCVLKVERILRKTPVEELLRKSAVRGRSEAMVCQIPINIRCLEQLYGPMLSAAGYLQIRLLISSVPRHFPETFVQQLLVRLDALKRDFNLGFENVRFVVHESSCRSLFALHLFVLNEPTAPPLSEE